MNARPCKLLIVGMDGLMYEMLEKFSGEGLLPNLTALMEEGLFTRSFPSPPCDTPTNWTTIASGAWTGTHGCNSFRVHYDGEPFEETHSSRRSISPDFLSIFKYPRQQEPLSRMRRAEVLWEAASRAGKRCILVDWPGGYPSTTEDAIAIDGSGPYCSDLVRVTTPHHYASGSQGAQENRIPLTVTEARGWSNAPASQSPPLESALVVTGEGTASPQGDGWSVNTAEGAGPVDPSWVYHLLVTDSAGDGYDQVLVSRTKDAGDVVTTLSEGEWSDWLELDLRFSRDVEEEPLLVPEPYTVDVETQVIFKLRLASLSRDGRDLGLYRTTLFNLKGWVYPEHVARDMVDHLYQESLKAGDETGIGTDGTTGEVLPPIPMCLVRESVEDRCEGVAMSCEYLSQSHEWDVLMAQVHAPDGFNHRYLNALTPGTSAYDPSKEEEVWEKFRGIYGTLDSMLGRIVRSCADQDTLVAVVSDHAGLPSDVGVSLPYFFEKAGLTTYKRDQESGEVRVDWSKSRAVAGNFPLVNAWVNLKGRDPQGIVEPGEEYDKVCSEIIDLLYSIRHDKYPERPIAMALRKDEAEFMGQWGDTVGDVVLFWNSPYAEAGLSGILPESFHPDFEPDYYPFEPFCQCPQAEHDPYLPWGTYGGFSNSAVLLMAGKGVKKGYRRATAINQVDVAPTLSHLCGLPLPRDCEGKVVVDALEPG